jgi:hypothetical protein
MTSSESNKPADMVPRNSTRLGLPACCGSAAGQRVHGGPKAIPRGGPGYRDPKQTQPDAADIRGAVARFGGEGG